jgi:uncharacterized protein YraI
MKLPNIAKAAGFSTAVILMSAGIASAAIATANANVRTGPSTGFRAVDTLSPGEQVAIVDRDGSWCAVQKAGPDGWVACAYLADGVRIRDRDFRDEPSVSLSFGVGVRPDRPRRPPQRMWWYDDDDYYYLDRRPSNSFSLSLGG